MRTKLTVFILLAVALVFGLLFARQAYLSKGLSRRDFIAKKVRVLTYSTFVGSSGPGAEIIKRFEKETGADVDVITAGDAGLLLERMKLGEASVPFDVVIGIDQLMLGDAEAQFKWKPQVFASSGRHPVIAEFASANFLPFDWSPLTFVFRKGAFPAPKNFADLLDPALKEAFALQDPRSSSPGLQFFHWVKRVKGAETEAFLRAFQSNVHSISPSWSFSYGLFKKEQTRFVFSYLTSLAFHWGVEEKREYQVVSLAEGHPVQIEYVGVPESCRECDLAQKFAETLLQPWAQKLIMEKNFMFPVIKGLEDGTIFAELPQLKVIKTGTGKDLREWDQVFKR